jgi:lactoylglutathione lyase
MKRLILALTLSVVAGPLWAQSRPHVLGVAHIALRVSDVEQARVFYKDFLGFGEPYELNNRDGSLALTFIKVNDRQYIELFPGLGQNQDRLNHISFYVDDAEAMRAYLRSRGVAAPEKLTKARIGTLNFNVKDPDGHTVEIVEYTADSWAARESGKFMTDERISQRIMHVGVIVRDLPKAMAFYRDILGFAETWRGAARDSETLSWVNLKVPDGGDYVEFMLYAQQPAPDRRGVQHHLCLEIEDAETAVARLNRRRYRQSYTRDIEIRTGINRKRQVNLYDPDGTRVELMESRTVDGTPAPASTLPPPSRD